MEEKKKKSTCYDSCYDYIKSLQEEVELESHHTGNTTGENGRLYPYFISLCYTTLTLVLNTNSQAQNTVVPRELKHIFSMNFLVTILVQIMLNIALKPIA